MQQVLEHCAVCLPTQCRPVSVSYDSHNVAYFPKQHYQSVFVMTEGPSPVR